MRIDEIIAELKQLELAGLYERDFLSAEQKTDQELAGLFAVADALDNLRSRNYDAGIFSDGLALWEGSVADGGFLPFAAGCAMLGLQVAAVPFVGAEQLRAGAPDVLSGTDLERCRELAALAGELYQKGQLRQRPVTVCPERGLGFALELLHRWNGAEYLRGKTLAIFADRGGGPAGEAGQVAEVCGRFGMDVCYYGALTTEQEDRLTENAKRTGGAFRRGQDPEGALWASQVQWPPKGTPAGPDRRAYLWAAAVFLAKTPQPAKVLEDIQRRAKPRRLV